jgi:octaheme c-type cytochrome (tetrathionate reductase family)
MSLSDHTQKLSLLVVVVVTIAIIAALQITHQPEEPNLALEELRIRYARVPEAPVDHSRFAELDRVFETPQEVTQACIDCHTTRHEEVMGSNHWNWERISYIEGRGIRALGKRNALNNYCISVAGNEVACAKCHTGFGLNSIENFDFNDPNNVDCLSCHDNSGLYVKGAGAAGFPAESVDLTEVAMSVGSPIMSNCGSCHFYSGGGNNVKHGDLEEALYNANRELDVHMAANGINMSCVDCHTAENHVIKGKLYSVSSENVNRLFCEDCHTPTPHLSTMLNTHAARVSCQTCHIPTYAKESPTKLSWRWSEAGQLQNGDPYHVEDTTGQETYLSIKGSFEWGEDLTPDYVWFNGKADHYFIGDKVDTTQLPLKVNELLGGHDDPQSKIIPVKIHRGDQIFDTENLMLIQPKLYAAAAGDSAYWKDFDWDAAAAAGMKEVGLPYSGNYSFIDTEMYWPINHMVAPASEALQCQDCHTRSDGRLAELTGFYMPGRDHSTPLDTAGTWLIVLTLFGIVVHGSFRVVTHIKTEEKLEMPHYKEFEDGKDNT